MAEPYVRPATPQAMVHRLPDKPDLDPETFTQKPEKFIIIIVASTAAAGKVQIAKTVSAALDCPLFQGDSLHETAAKAARVGVATDGANETRYQRMWLSKMTRTGLLFPDESHAAGAGFSGFGGNSSTSTSRRGSASSDAGSETSLSASDAASLASSVQTSGAPKFTNKPPPQAALSQADALRKAKPALVLLTHPKLESWQKACIRRSVGEYSIGVIFVPLDVEGSDLVEEDEDDSEDDLPVLRPLDPRTMASFGVFKPMRDWSEEILVSVNVHGTVEEIAEEVAEGVRDVMNE